MQRGALHHVELWVPDLAAARRRWEWLLGELGYVRHREWDRGLSLRLGPTYVVLEQSPAMLLVPHDRTRPGLNHLALHAGTRDELDRLVADAGEHGWALLFRDRHPFAGGPDTCAAYLEDEDGFEVELVVSA